MLFTKRTLLPLADRGPLRVLFALTTMPVGGAETLLVNLIRRLDRERFSPELVCLKTLGPLGEEMAKEIPTYSGLLNYKNDVRVLGRLGRLMKQRNVDAVITVGGGDKMFWGRLAAWFAGVPVVASALHSTGWPDGVNRVNRLLTPITDAFIAVAAEHGRFLIDRERFPIDKVHVIPNGIDTERFQPCPEYRALVRKEIGIAPDVPVCGIVAALRPEKNHPLFLQAAALVKRDLPTAQFVVVGDSPQRPELESLAESLGIRGNVHFLGTRSDIPRLLAAMDLFVLTSDNEANPVSILEAMAVGLPVVATDVGSVAQSVLHDKTGLLTPPRQAEPMAAAWLSLLTDRARGVEFGRRGRERVVENGSLQAMVDGYQNLITDIYNRKCMDRRGCRLRVKRDTIASPIPHPE